MKRGGTKWTGRIMFRTICRLALAKNLVTFLRELATGLIAKYLSGNFEKWNPYDENWISHKKFTGKSYIISHVTVVVNNSKSYINSFSVSNVSRLSKAISSLRAKLDKQFFCFVNFDYYAVLFIIFDTSLYFVFLAYSCNKSHSSTLYKKVTYTYKSTFKRKVIWRSGGSWSVKM